MNRQEEENTIEQSIGQEEPQPSKLVQTICLIAFIGFIVLYPTIVEKLK